MTTTELPASSASAGRVLQLFLRAVTAILLIFTAAAFLARFNWRCELLCHFRWQYGWLLAGAAGLLWFRKDQWLAMIAGFGVLANWWFVLPVYLPAPTIASTGPTWKLVSFNVLSSNDQTEDVVAWLTAHQADVILLLEFDAKWARAIEPLHESYPHRQIVPRDDNFGYALLSRIPWMEVKSVHVGSANLPSVVARLQLGDGECTFIGTHPLPPGTARLTAARNSQLTALAQLVRETRGPVVLAGDLNVTSYSPFFHDLCSQSQLRDSRQGFGIQASWSPRLPLLAIPIDHCLVSPDVTVDSRHVGPHLGSDHRPVIVELRTN